MKPKLFLLSIVFVLFVSLFAFAYSSRVEDLKGEKSVKDPKVEVKGVYLSLLNDSAYVIAWSGWVLVVKDVEVSSPDPSGSSQ